MSVRRHLLAPALVLAAVAGLLQFNGFRVVSDALGVSLGDASTVSAVVRVLAFAVGVLGPAALGYRVGTRADLREDYAALALVVGLAALVGFAVAAAVTVSVTAPARFRWPLPSAVVFFVVEPAKFALFAEAGAAVGYFRARARGTHRTVAG